MKNEFNLPTPTKTSSKNSLFMEKTDCLEGLTASLRPANAVLHNFMQLVALRIILASVKFPVVHLATTPLPAWSVLALLVPPISPPAPTVPYSMAPPTSHVQLAFLASLF